MELIWHLYMHQHTRVTFLRYIHLQLVDHLLVCFVLLFKWLASIDFVARCWCIWSEVIGGSPDVSCDRFHSDEGIAIQFRSVSLTLRTLSSHTVSCMWNIYMQFWWMAWYQTHSAVKLFSQEEQFYEIDVPLKFTASVCGRVHGLACWFDVLFDGRY